MVAKTQRSFIGGELTPSLHSRVDLSKYHTGLKTCSNTIIRKSGGAFNRSGTRFLAECNDIGGPTHRIIPFVPSSSSSYILEFGDMYVRVYDVINPSNPILVQEVVSPYRGSDVFELDYVQIVDTMTITHRVYRPIEFRRFLNSSNIIRFRFQEVDLDAVATRTLRSQPVSFVVQTSAGGTISYPGGSQSWSYIVTYIDDNGTESGPLHINVADLNQRGIIKSISKTNPCRITFVDNLISPIVTGDYIQIDTPSEADSNPNYFPELRNRIVQIELVSGTEIDLINVDATNFTDTIDDPQSDAELRVSAELGAIWKAQINLPGNGIGGGHRVVLSWSPVRPFTRYGYNLTGAREYNVYKREDGGEWGLLGISSAPTFIDIGQDLERKNIPESNFLFEGVHRNPSTVAYIQQRIAYSGNTENPERIIMSRTGDFTNFVRRSPLQADDAFNFVPAGDKLNRVRWMFDINRLVVLGDGSEWVVNGNEAGIITPTTVNVRQQSQYGAGDVRPIIISKSGLYVPRRGRGVREITYSRQVVGMDSYDLTIFADHLFKEKSVVDWAYEQTPDSIVWCVMNDGTMLGLTRIPEQEVLAWHRHNIRDAEVESIANLDQGTFMVVSRMVNGNRVRYIEYMENRDTTDIFMDSAIVITGVADETTPQVVTGLEHLEGESVAVVADNAVLANPINPDAATSYTVTGGEITLPRSHRRVTVGLPYVSDIETLDIDIADPGTISDKFMLVKRLTLLLEKTRGIFMSNASSKRRLEDELIRSGREEELIEGMTEMRVRDVGLYVDTNKTFSGKISHNIDSSWDSNGSVLIRQIHPLPMGILSVTPEGDIPIGRKG